MTKVLLFVKRKASLSHEQFHARYESGVVAVGAGAFA